MTQDKKYQLPSVESYGEYTSDNYGVNTLLITVAGLELFYSYKTIVDFRTIQDGLVCSDNVWSVTTGKHLNWIQSDKSKRVPNVEFNKMLQIALSRLESKND